MLKTIEWIVVPGGPGISKSYLQTPLDSIFEGCKLHYYDPYGTYQANSSEPVTLTSLVTQIFEVADSLKLKNFGIIAHSFGTYLTLRALDLDKSRIEAMLFLNPMPLTKVLWQSSLKKISSSVSTHELERISALSNKENHEDFELFKTLLPYYTARKIFALPSVRFNYRMCEKLASEVPDYNHLNIVKTIQVPFVSIHGNKDPFYYPDMFPEHSSVILKDIGHYPFYEDLVNLKKCINKVLLSICELRE